MRYLLAKVCGNRLAQKLLQYVVFVAQYFQGIGSGSSVGESGEKAVFDRLLKHVDAPCVFDVGANKGQFLTLARSCIGQKKADIHCFEPSEVAFSTLKSVVANDARVHINHTALGRKSGEATLYYDEQASGLASMSKRNLDHLGIDFDRCESIQVNTLIDYCTLSDIQHIDLLKMDVEGHEMDVLKGGEGLFQRHAIGMVLFEFGGANIDTRSYFRDFHLFFKQYDMVMFRITPSGYLVPVEQYDELCEQFRTTNYICMSGRFV